MIYKCKICSKPTNIVNKKYKLVKCVNCELIFCSDYYTQDELLNLYDKLYNNKNA
jgi:DNA-directed RNA polymerase subunit RPC12/RpoP